ncbi:MAG: mandelate racemase/muconate lactonizing enzyme family protein [Candidatus Bathyarchaeia archaeon]
MKIVDLKCTVVEGYPIVRIDTDEGISGLAQIEKPKYYIKPHVLFYKRYIIGQDPTNVERVMLRIRNLGGFKPWGSAVSAIEIALWDIAGKAAGLPVYRLLGGKIRDKVRVYNTGVGPAPTGFTPEEYAESARKRKALPEGFKIFKFGIGFHTRMPAAIPNFFYGEVDEGATPYPNRGRLTEKGLKHMVECVKALKEVLGDEYGLALDCGPGFDVQSALSLAKALEPFNLMWLEDMITGDYTPYTAVEAYRLVSSNTITPIHTGEQIYLRQGFKDLIEKNAVDVIGPDPCDVGGLAELKWVAEFADLHSILIAPHGVFDGIIGVAALTQVCATLPKNFIAFEMPVIEPVWWDLVKGLPNPPVKDGYIEVQDKPGLGVEINEKALAKYLPEGDDFLDYSSKK